MLLLIFRAHINKKNKIKKEKRKYKKNKKCHKKNKNYQKLVEKGHNIQKWKI